MLRRDRPTRHIVERVLSRIVELAGSINTHVVAAVLGRVVGVERNLVGGDFHCGIEDALRAPA